MQIKSEIEKRLKSAFEVEFLQVSDESWQHGGGPDAQSHFKILVVSEQFSNQKLLARHRAVQALLPDIISQIRALSLHTLTPDEWEKSGEKISDFRSPGCHNKQ